MPLMLCNRAQASRNQRFCAPCVQTHGTYDTCRCGEQALPTNSIGARLVCKVGPCEPRECRLQPELLTSSRAVLHCGPVQKGDIIFFTDMSCGVVQAFFYISWAEVYFVEVNLLPAVNNDASLRDARSNESCFKESRFVVDSCIWHSTENAGIVRVCVPPILLF